MDHFLGSYHIINLIAAETNVSCHFKMVVPVFIVGTKAIKDDTYIKTNIRLG